MKVQLLSGSLLEIKTDVLAMPLFEGEKPTYNNDLIKLFLGEHPKFGKDGDIQLLFSPKQKLLLVGAGKKDKFNYQKAQNLAGTIAKFLLGKYKECLIVTPDEFVEPFVIGVELAVHDPALSYKSEKEKNKLSNVVIWVEKATREAQDGQRRGMILAEFINVARELGDMPPNDMTPTYFLNVTKKLAKEGRLKLTVIDEKQAKKLGMGGFVGVAQGSEEPSFMILLEYKGDTRSKEVWGLVGKGITLDTGGISLKPAASIPEMKYDMSGAGTVLAATIVLARMRVKANITSVMAVTENLLGGRAQRPGDVVRLYNGKTAEVLNTDAEGRLVLADALTLAQKKGATKLIDVATLTGACVVALGGVASGVMGNNPKFTQDLIMAGVRVGEVMWELPMLEEYDEMIKSDIADIANIGHGGPMPGAAGAIMGGKFLEAVIEKDRPWVHIDIAGTAWDMKPKPYRGPGATGIGIKTLVELIG